MKTLNQSDLIITTAHGHSLRNKLNQNMLFDNSPEVDCTLLWIIQGSKLYILIDSNDKMVRIHENTEFTIRYIWSTIYWSQIFHKI